MNAVSRGFAQVRDRKGQVIGIIPGSVNDENGEYTPISGYPNRWVEIKIFTHLPYSGARGMSSESRNHINILSSDVIIVLPGQSGTASEVQLAIRYNKPIIAWLDDHKLIKGLHSDVPVVSSIDHVKEFVTEQLLK